MSEKAKIDNKIQQGKDMLSAFRLGQLKLFHGILLFFLWAVPLSLILLISFALTGIRKPSTIMIFIIYCMACVGMMFSLGVLCVISGRLRIAKRMIIWMMIWIPFVNYGLSWYVHSLVKEEIDHNVNKISLDDVRVEHQSGGLGNH